MLGGGGAGGGGQWGKKDICNNFNNKDYYLKKKWNDKQDMVSTLTHIEMNGEYAHKQ